MTSMFVVLCMLPADLKLVMQVEGGWSCRGSVWGKRYLFVVQLLQTEPTLGPLVLVLMC